MAYDPLDPDDTAGAAFQRLLRDFPDLREHPVPDSVLSSVLRHHDVDERRRASAKKRGGRRVSSIDGVESKQWYEDRHHLERSRSWTDPAEEVIARELAERLHMAMNRVLTPAQREALQYYMRDWTNAAIARALSRTVAAIKGLIKRALAALREFLAPHFLDEIR
jgi:RNA polymerase sigma factor (sigma-70 family)